MNVYYLRSMIKPFYKLEGKIIFIKYSQIELPDKFLTKRALKYVYLLRDKYGYSVQLGI